MIKHYEDMKYQCLFNVDEAFIIEEEKDYWKRRIKEQFIQKLSNRLTNMT